MARETKNYNGATRDDLKKVGTYNCNYDPYEMITYQNYRLQAQNNYIHALECMIEVPVDSDESMSSVFINAVHEGL